MFGDDFNGINPLNFFQIISDCRYLPEKKFGKKYADFLVPDSSPLSGEDNFAEVAMGWHEEGIILFIKVQSPFEAVSYPDVTEGDSVELFFDTRDVKTSGFNTRFCHRFFFLPEAINGHLAGEITRFRSEEKHPLCDPTLLKNETVMKKDGYEMNIFIPSECLSGYDPGQFDRIGFSYRINRAGESPQHLSALTEEFRIEEQPSLWASFRLVR